MVKDALLRRYALTEDEFRKRFFMTGVNEGETVQQFMARLEQLFAKWIEASKIEQNYLNLKNLIIHEGFLQRCEENLKAYLKEKSHTELDDMVVSAQKYIGAHGRKWNIMTGSKTDYSGLQHGENYPCSICKKSGHKEEKCWFRETEKTDRRCFRRGSTEHLIRDCTKDKGSVGSTSVVRKWSASDIQEGFKGLSPPLLGKELRVPMTEGKINGHSVAVMRDTGFGSAAVKSRFVDQENYVDEYGEVHLLDNTRRTFRKAIAEVESKPFTGMLKVLVVDTLVVDCVIDNIDGLQDESSKWFKEDNTSEECAAAVLARAQAQNLKRPIKPLPIENSELVDRNTFVQLPHDDVSLNKLKDTVEKMKDERDIIVKRHNSQMQKMKEELGNMKELMSKNGENETDLQNKYTDVIQDMKGEVMSLKKEKYTVEQTQNIIIEKLNNEIEQMKEEVMNLKEENTLQNRQRILL